MSLHEIFGSRTGSFIQLVTIGLLIVGCQAATPPAADLVVLGGRIVTMDADQPEVEALAVTGDRIAAIGTRDAIKTYIGPETEILELSHELVVPGLIDSHAHFLGIGQAKMRLDLTRADTWQELVKLVAEAAESAAPGEWILGRGWHQEKWSAAPTPAHEGLPFHHDLSRVTPENPVLLTHASGHAVMVNKMALELAGIDRDTPSPPGGEIVRDSGGEAIGVLRETAEDLVAAARSATAGSDSRRKMARLAAQECLANGVTTVHDAGVSFDDVELFRELAETGELQIRLWVMLSASNDALEERLASYDVQGIGHHHLTVGGIKRLMDGALGSHGAWLLEPYDDLPGSTGLSTISIEALDRTADLALEHNLQLCVHAIGDRANREVLDLYARKLDPGQAASDRRWRIEHAQHLHPDDVARFASQGVIAAMQPVHCTSDAPWVLRRLGKQRAQNGAYLWRDLLDSGARICSGTDAPVEHVSPIATFYAAVTRRLADGGEFFPAQAMSREEALRAATIDSAFAAFEEDLKGSLAPGKLADMVVLSKDILTVPEEEILSTKVLHTVVGGKVLYSSRPAQAREHG